ncbi:hypothetical protein EC991_009641 [Linnemannia zychae]|nr:hypothetical protein EC991_009641 [Linnemannia zychae]
MTNPSEIESHPVETLKAQKQHDAAHPSLSETPLEVADHPIPPQSQGGLNVLQAHHGAGLASAGIVGVPHYPPKEDHHEHEHKHGHEHAHKHDHVHHEGEAHDHHGNPSEPLKNKTLGFDYHQLPTM